MSKDPNPLLVVARSGRALAQSARRGGWHPLVVDAFADVDTQACAQDFRQVSVDGEVLHARSLRDAITALTPIAARLRLVYGGALESMPALLERLSARYEIIGNSADTLRAVKDPNTFFPTLDALKITYPETRRTATQEMLEQGGSWLVKRAAGGGGTHVRVWDGASRVESGHYLQRYVPGPVMSVLFAADGVRARMIGYNTQWTASLASRPFTYGGAVNRAQLTPRQRQTVAAYAEALTRAFGLRGLNSLDFILNCRRPLVLEINPRPTATCELYEPDTRDGMLTLHVHACGGALPARALGTSKVRAHTIVYAQVPCHIAAAVQWPQWCRDLPVTGAQIAAGEPVCSVYTEGDDVDFVRQLSEAQGQFVLSLVEPRPVAA
jgi:predicted ATP-grasp superfamily ATP-dependent carboligase